MIAQGVAVDGAIDEDSLPVVIFSHGNAGWYGDRSDTAQGEIEYLEREETKGWRRYALIPFEDSLTTRPIGYSEDGKELFWIDSRGRDRSAGSTECFVTERAGLFPA
jgi:hypothetical protein